MPRYSPFNTWRFRRSYASCLKRLELARGIEPPTCGLQNRCSAIELRQLLSPVVIYFQLLRLPPIKSAVCLHTAGVNRVFVLRHFPRFMCEVSSILLIVPLSHLRRHVHYNVWPSCMAVVMKIPISVDLLRHSVADHENEIQALLLLPFQP